MGRIRELDAPLFEGPEDGQVDRLLHIHEYLIVRLQHEVHDLEVERRGAIALEMRTIEAREFLGFDDLPHHDRDGFQRLDRSPVVHPEPEEGPPFGHPLVVADPAGQEIVVRQDQLFPGEATDPRGLEADALHGAGIGVQHDEVADHERLVQRDRERCEQVAEDALERQRHRNAADAHAGHERRDVQSGNVVQGHQQDDAVEHDPGHEHGHPHRGDPAAIVVLASFLVVDRQQIDQPVGPDAHLDEQRTHGQCAQPSPEPGRQFEYRCAGIQGQYGQQEQLCPCEHADEQVIQVRGGTLREALQATDDHVDHQPGGDGQHHRNGEPCQPRPQRIAEQYRIPCRHHGTPAAVRVE